MEELRSTEVLDKEILEDARKKAHKILQTADEALEAQNRDWEKKIQRSVKSIKRTYEARLKKTTEEIFARFPLDQRRLDPKQPRNFCSRQWMIFSWGLSGKNSFPF